jgi:hypothetical protein
MGKVAKGAQVFAHHCCLSTSVDPKRTVSLGCYQVRPDDMPPTFESRLDLCRVCAATLIISLPGIALGEEVAVGRFGLPFELPEWLIILLATSALGAGVLLRVKFVRPAEIALRSGETGTSLSRWSVGQLSSSTYAETIAFMGMVWRIQGGSLRFASLFYASGFVLLLLWFPRRP